MGCEIEEARIEHIKDILNLNQKLFDFDYKYFDKTLDCSWPLKNEK